MLLDVRFSPKAHHIPNGGGFNLKNSLRSSTDATRIRTRLARFYDTVAPVYGFWSRLFEGRAALRVYEAARLSGKESSGWKIGLREQIPQWGFRPELIVAQFPAGSRR